MIFTEQNVISTEQKVNYTEQNVIYTEQFNGVPTNENGLFSLVIGTGTKVGNSPDFEELSWNVENISRRLKVEINEGGLIEVGSVQLMSVPFAHTTRHFEK